MKKTAAHTQPSVINLPERIEQLSAKRQEVIRPILEHPREYVLLSVRAVAKRLHTDPATVVRIVRGLGFSTYREFQHHLHELSLAFATSLDTMQAGSRDSNMPAYVRDSLGQDLKNLQGLKNSLDAQRLAALAKRFYEARRILLLASDLAAAPAGPTASASLTPTFPLSPANATRFSLPRPSPPLLVPPTSLLFPC